MKLKKSFFSKLVLQITFIFLSSLSFGQAITSFTRTSGPIGSTVNITGTDLTGASAVTFNGTSATIFTVNSATSITATVPTGATTGAIAVTTPLGSVTSSSNFTVAGQIVVEYPFNNSLNPSIGSGAATIVNPGTLGTTATLSTTTICTDNVNTTGYLQTANVTFEIAAFQVDLDFSLPELPTGQDRYLLNYNASMRQFGVKVSSNGRLGVHYMLPSSSVDINSQLSSFQLQANTNYKLSLQYVSNSIRLMVDSNIVLVVDVPQGIEITTNRSFMFGDAPGSSSSMKVCVDNFRVFRNPQQFAFSDQLVVNPSSFNSFNSCVNSPSAAQTFTVSGSNLSNNTVTVSPPTANYEISLNGDSYTSGSINLTAVSGTLSPITLHIRSKSSPTALSFPQRDGILNVQVSNSSFPIYRQSFSLNGATGVIINDPNPIAIGDAKTLTLTGYTTTAAGSSPWISSDVNVATVNSSGVVTGIAAGTATITFTNEVGCQATRSITVFLPGPPTITSFTPLAVGIGNPVTISGTNFRGASFVGFNGTSATFTMNAAGTIITATVPPEATAGKITVTTAGGTITSASDYTVVPAPTITSFTPSSGAEGTAVTITGTNFTNASAVRFNGTAAISFSIVSDTSITVTVRTGATTGTISVTTPGGTATSSSNYTVSPTITSFTPSSGTSGATVTITGRNFTDATAVSFNGTAATTFSVASATSITATVPTGATTGTIVVTTPGGTATSATSFTVVSLNPTLTLSNTSIPTLSNCKIPRVIPDHATLSTDITITASDIVNIRVPNPFSQIPLNNPFLVYQNGADWKYYITPLYTSGNATIGSTNAITLNELLTAYPGIKAESDNIRGQGITSPTSFDQVRGVAASANTILPYYESFTVSGLDLSSNVTITPPANFQIATNPTTWIGSSSSLTLSPTSGTVVSTLIYVRPVPGIAAGSYSGNITVVSGSINSTKAVSASISTPIAFTTEPVEAVSVCQNSTYSLTAAATGTGLTYQWFSNTTNSTLGGTNLGSANGAQTASLSINTATVGTTYYYVVASGACGSIASTVSTVTVTAPSVGGTAAAAALTICPNTTTTLSVTGYTGSTIQWQQSANGTTGWVNVSGGSGATTFNYTTTELTSPTYYRAVVANGSCNSAVSTTVAIAIHAPSTGGTASVPNSLLAAGASTTISLTGHTGAIQWQQSTDGNVWTSVASGTGATTASYTTSSLLNSTYFRAEVNNASCNLVYSNAVLLTFPYNINLSSLAVGTGTLTPTFNSSTLDYAVVLNAGATSFSFTPTLNDSNGTITINGVTHTNASSFSDAINGQSKSFLIRATSADGMSSKEYRLNILVPTVSNSFSVSPTSVKEGDSHLNFIVTGTPGAKVSLELAAIIARGKGIDYGALSSVTTVGQSDLETSIDMGVTWTRFNNFIAIPSNTLLWVRTPIIDDEIIEPDELLKLIVYPLTETFDGKEIIDVNNERFNLDFTTLVSGTAKRVGAIYRTALFTVNGVQLHARARVTAISNVVSSPWGDYLIDKAGTGFTPVLNSDSSSGSYMNFEIKFYKGNTTVEVALKDFTVTINGLDYRSSLQLNKFTSYRLGNASSIRVAPALDGLVFVGSGSVKGFKEQQSIIVNYSNPVNSIQLSAKVNGSTKDTRYSGYKTVEFEMLFGDYSNDFSIQNPKGTFTSASADATIVDNEPIQLKISNPVLTKTKSYSGTTTAAVVKGVVIGIKPGDDVTVTAVATYENASVGVAKKITVVYSISGVNSANYIAPLPFEVTDGVINPLDLVITPTAGLTKVYGSPDPILTYTTSGALAGETPLINGVLVRAVGNSVGNYAISIGSLMMNDNGTFKATNYNLILSPNSNFSITKAPLTVQVLDDSKFVTKPDVIGYAGVSYIGFVFGETKAVLDESNLTISRSNVGEEIAGEYIGVLNATGVAASNYELNYQSGNYTIIAADQLRVQLQNAEAAYGAVASYQVVSAQYLSSSNSTVVDLTQNATISNNKVTVTDGSGGSAIFDIIPLQPAYSSTSRLKVGNYELDATNIIIASSNFNNSIVLQGNLRVTARNLTIAITNGLTKIYDGNALMNNVTLSTTDAFFGDKVAPTGSGVYSSKNAGSPSYVVSNIVLSGVDSENYYVNGGASATINGNNGLITTRTLFIIPTNNQSKIFGDLNPILAYNYSGHLGNETPNFSGALSRISGENVGVYPITIGTLATADQSSFLATNYTLEFTSGIAFTITKKQFSISDLTISSPQSVIYSGQLHTPEPQVSYNSIVLVKGTDFTYSYSNNKAAGIATVSITGTGNYSGMATITFEIQPKLLSITATSSSSKVYGDQDPVFSYSFSGTIAGEVPLFTGALSREFGENVGVYDYNLGDLTIGNTSTFNALNYYLALSNNETLTITKAPLTITVNDNSKFVTQNDAVGYAGISITGLQFGETRAVLNDTNLVITRTNSGVQSAGVYSNVLVASGLTSDNYSFTYVPADFTIVGADQLVVKVADVQTVYGGVANYTLVSAKYMIAGNTIVDLTSSSTISNGVVTVQDGSSGSAIFTIAVVNPILSTSSKLAVGSYALGASNSIETTTNFNNTIEIQGIHTVVPKELLVTVTSSRTKVYDGNDLMPPVVLSVVNKYPLDLVSATGSGQFDGATVGDKTYTISNIIVSGADARNYYINGGASTILVATDGKITKRSLEIVPKTGQSKVFGQLDPQFEYNYSGNVNGETPIFSGGLARVTGEAPGTYLINVGNLQLSSQGSLEPSNYNLSFFNNVSFTIGRRHISSGSIIINPIQDLTYSGQAQLPLPVIKDGIIDLVSGVDYTLTYSNHINVGTATITIVGIGSYTGTKTVTFRIKEKQLIISPTTGLTKVYGDLDPILTYGFSGAISGETPLFTGTLSRNIGENVGSYTLVRGTLGLADNGSFKASNYLVTLVENVSLSITKANLIVKVNNDSKFVTRPDTSGYAGISFLGFKFGENSNVIDQTGLIITRTNAGASGVELAQFYPGVLSASGLASGNYNFIYQSGDYTIVGADQLLVKVTNLQTTYGTTSNYEIASAQYVSTGNTIVDLTSSTTVVNGTVTVQDGSSGGAVFDISVVNPIYSTSGKLKVGTYILQANNIVETSANFNNTIIVQGIQTVIPKALTPSITSAKTKVYDGNRQMPSLILALATIQAQDIVTATGTALFDSPNGGTQSYKITDIILSGTDSNNYFVTGGTSAIISGTDGLISKRALTVTVDNKNKFRDTSDPLFTVVVAGLISGETLSNLSGSLTTSRAPGEALGTYAISSAGLISDNYSFTYVPGILTIETSNVSPTDISISSNIIIENNSIGSILGALSTTDANLDDTHAYTLVSGAGATDNTFFTIVGNQLRSNEVFDFETKNNYSVRIRTTDSEGLFFDKVITITVNDSNELPTDIGLTSSSINENVTVNTIVGVLSTTDVDSNNTHAYTLVSGIGDSDNNVFTIVGSDLKITASPDYETKSSYSIRVRSTDQGGLFFDKVITITVNDIQENVAPINISLSASAIDENNALGAVIGTLSSTDSDNGDSHTYTLVTGAGSDDNASFSIVSNQLKAAVIFDYEIKSSYTLRIKTTDAGGLNYEKSFTITIGNVNETPVLSLSQNNFTGVIGSPLATISLTTSGGVVSSFLIVPSLPAGLQFNTTNGSISGTPTVTSTSQTYTISATNSDGTGTASFTLFIDSDLDGDGIGDTTDPDIDGDGVPNTEEIQEGTSPTDPTDYKDTDGDGVPDYVEVQQGTNPNVPGDARDTDGDGVPDYIEILQGTNPNTPGDSLIDTDGDGVPDYVEVQQGSDPNNPNDSIDTDGDGIPDYVENLQGTNPNIPGDAIDTDGDGVPDYIEVQQGTNPNLPGDGRDTDGDGISDYVENLQGTNPNTPGDSLIDTDGDGVPDYVENVQGTNPNIPGDAIDTDGDGVPDYVEVQQGTNPNLPGDGRDTDGDGVPDYVEVQQGTNPNLPNNPVLDTDGDGIIDSIDTDDDGDTILDINDAFPLDKNEWKDTDGDGIGDNADTDDDNDGILDVCDVDVNGDGIPDNGTDRDGDGIIDSCDSDRDGDGVNNTSDNCPDTPNRDQADRDRDGKGDVCDTIELNVAAAITPNGDGINDTWVIYNIENHPGSIVRVFNTNGKQVFYSANYKNDWNGNYQGSSEMLPVGSYLFQIDLDGDGTIDSQGWLYITK